MAATQGSWSISGTTATYTPTNAQEATVTITGLTENATVSGLDDPSTSTAISLTSDMLPDSPTANATITVTEGYTLALGDGITKYDASSGTPALNFTSGVTVQRTPTSAWDGDGTATLTYTVGTPVTLATINGLANTAAAANVKLGSVDGAGAFTEGTGTVIQLDTGALGNSDVTFTTNMGSYTLALASTVLKTKTLDSYEITITADTEDATATVLGQYKTYYTEGTESDAGQKIAYHSAEKDDENSPAAKITGLKKSAVRGTDIIFGVDTNVSDKTITLKESALIKEAEKAVVLTSSAFTFNLDAVTESGTDYSTPEVTFPDTPNGSATITTTPNAGWERSNSDKTITYKEPEAVLLANISGLADDADETTVTVAVAVNSNTGTVTLQQAALAEEENTQATIADESNTTKYKDVKFVFELDNVDAPGTKAADGTVTGSTIAIDIDDINTGEATVVQTFQAGWTLDETDSKVTYKAAVPVTLATITGLKTDATAAAFDVSKLTSDKIVTLKQAALTEVGKPEAGETDARITLTPNTEALTGNESEYKSYNYTAADLKYGLALQSGTNGVTQTEKNNGTTVIAVVKNDPDTPAATEGEDPVPAKTATAYLAREKLEYWTADKAKDTDTINTVITYHPPGMSENGNDIYATVTGLKKDATAALSTDTTNAATAGVVFNTSAKTVTLKADALLTGEALVSGTTAVGLTTTDGYKLAIGDDVAKSGEIPETEGDPVLNTEKLATDGKVTVEQALTEGWALNDTSTTLTYSEPENDVLATITVTNAKSGADADGFTIGTADATTGVIPISVGADVFDSTTSGSETTLSIVNADGYTYALALADGVDKSGEDSGDAYISIAEAGQGEPTGTKTAKVMQDLTGGWSIPTEGTDAGKIIYTGANTNNVLATITGLAEGAATKESDAYTNVTLGTDTDNPTVVLKKAALPTSADGGDTVTLTNSGDNTYSLAFAGDVTDADKDPGTQIVEENDKQVVSMTVTNGTAEIKATLNEGWTLDDDENSDTYLTKITYTAPATNTVLATVTGLNTTKATYTENGTSNTVDFTITAAAAADTGVITLKTDALTNSSVVLTNEKSDVAAFTLKLQAKNENDNYEDVTIYGYEPTYAWTKDNTGTTKAPIYVANYRTSQEEGWTLDNDESSDTYLTKITYNEEVLAKDSDEILATVSNLKDGFTPGTYDYTYTDTDNTEKTKTITAIGMGTGNDFVAGLYVTSEYEGTNVGDIYISKNVLNTDAANPVTLTKGTGDYAFILNTVDTKANEDLYVPTSSTATRNIWAVETVAKTSSAPKSTTATYKTVTPEYWTLGASDEGNGKKITYTAQADKENGTILTVTGLADGITVKDFEVDDPDTDKTDPEGYKTIKISKLVDSSGNVVANLGAYVEDGEDKVFTTQDAILGDSSITADVDTLQLNKGALTTMNVTFTAGKDTYDLALADAVTAPVFDDTKAKWAVTNGDGDTKTATYTGNVTTAGYDLSADQNTVKYTKTGNKLLATITGLDGSVVVSGTGTGNKVGTKKGSVFTQGITVGKTTVGENEDAVTYDAFELADNVLGTTTVTVTNEDTDIKDYKFALNDDVIDSTDPEVDEGQIGSVLAWRVEDVEDSDGVVTTTATYRELTPAYYTLDTTDNSTTYLTKITYTAEDAKEDGIVATITGLKAGLETTDSTYTDDDNELRTSIIEGISFDETDTTVIKLKQSVLATNDQKSATLTEGSYTLALDAVDAVEVDKDKSMSWSVEDVAATQSTPATKTAILKGSTTAGWTLNDDANTITYNAAESGRELVKITGLNSSVTTTKLKNAYGAALPANGTFELQEAFLTTSDVNITSGTLPNGKNIIFGTEEDDEGNTVEVKYGIAIDSALTTAAATAVEGDPRWYFSDDTTLALANIHDAHYVNGKLNDSVTDADKLDAGSFKDDPYTITYVEEIKDEADLTISNLASGLKLNGKGAYTGSGAYYIANASNTAPVDGITIGDGTITLAKKVISTTDDEDKPTTLTGSGYGFVLGNDVTAYNSTEFKKFAVDGTTATLSEGTEEGYELTDTDTKVVYHADTFKAVAEITGLKSGLKVGTDEEDGQAAVGTGTSTNFVAGLTYDNNTITATTAVLDATAGKAVTLINKDSNSYTLELDEAVPKPNEGHGWKYTAGTGDNLATAEYKSGTQAGWATTTADTKFTYQDAAYTGNTVATISGLANNLTVSDDYQTITTSAGKAAVYEATNEDGDLTNEIILTSYAFAKQDVTLTNATSQDATEYTLGLFQGQTKQTDGTFKNDDGYVTTSVTTKLWDKPSATKATYTITVPEGYNIATEEELAADQEAGATYDAKVSYIAPDKKVATLNGVNSSLTVSNDKTQILSGSTEAITVANQTTTDDEGTEQSVEGKYVLTVKDAALNQAKLTLAKGDFILDFDSTKPEDPVWNKAANSTKAYYTQSYAADSYELAADAMSIAYTKNRVDTLFTLDGLDKDLVATNSKESITDSSGNVKVTVTTKPKTSTSSNVFAETTDEDEKINIVQLASRDVLNSGSAVKLTNGKVGNVTQEYRLWLGTDTTDETEAAKAFASGNYADSEDYNNQPLWTVDNKGKATLDEGTYEGWSYKVNKDNTLDYTNLVYVKPTKVITATLTGLATNLMVDPETGDIYTTNTDGTAKDEAVSFTPKEGTNPGTISLTSAALPTGNLKNNTKIALALGKVNGTVVDYKLSGEEVSDDDKTSNKDSVWSVNKGVASYQYDTTAGWTFSDTGAIYTDAKTTLVAKISGIRKDFSTLADPNNKKSTDNPVEELDYIDVSISAPDSDGKQTFTFTLTDADYLAGSKVTLTKANKKDTNTYILKADDSLAPYEFADGNEDHPAQWTVNTKNGSAKLTAGTSAGYTNLESSEKNYGNVVNYSKENTKVTYFTISGLLKEKENTGTTTLETMIVENGAITYDVANQKVSLNNAAVLGTSTVSLASGKDANKQAYAFTFDADALAGATDTKSVLDTNYDITLQAKGSTVNLVETATANKFALSTDGKKLNYNKKNVDTVLATIKSLNKTLVNNTAGNVVTSETSTDPVVTFDGEYGNATITLAADALANSNITFTTNKKLTDHTYTLALADDDAIITTKQTQTEWTFSNGTASYRNYTKGYYTSDEKGGYKYNKETKGTTYATISGLNPNADATALTEAFNEATSNYGGTITLDSSMLVTTDKNGAASGKAVTLKNSATKNEHETTFALDLDTTDLATAMVSKFSVGDNFTNGKLTGTYSTGYALASDTSITYLAKEKGNQLVASLNGTTGTVTASSDGTISLSSSNLTGKSVTLTTTDLATVDYKLSFTNTGRGITSADDTDDRSNGWEVKNGKATFTGYVTTGYKLAESGKAITYNKAVGDSTKDKPAVAMTISNVTAASGDSSSVAVTGTTDGKATTLSNGLIAVEFSGYNIVGSGEADKITLMTAASVKGGKGDDNITLSTGSNTILYGNGDGNDVVEGFSSSDKIILTGGKLTGVVTNDDGYAVVKVGTGSITLSNYSGTTVNINNENYSVANSSDVLFEDNNYSTDAAALSDIVEPFKASYTPYDFESGLDLVKKDSFTPAVTYNGDDKK